MSRPEWAHIDLRDALHELLVDIVVVAKSEDIHLYDLFHGAIGGYFQETRDESIFFLDDRTDYSSVFIDAYVEMNKI